MTQMKKQAGRLGRFGKIGCSLLILLISCASTKSRDEEYILDAQNLILKGPEQIDDIPIQYCETSICYVYTETEARKIKKYIVSLEERLKACQEKKP